MTAHGGDGSATRGDDYTARLKRRTETGWRAYVDVQRPYRRNIARQQPGRCIDVGCGIGRHLSHLPEGSVGVDHNPTSVATCRERGLEAYTPEHFAAGVGDRSFDSMLVAHVLEHVDQATSTLLLGTYGAFLRPGGRAIVITPQERGFRSDATHIRWMGFDEVAQDLRRAGFDVVSQSSFPFPRIVGRVFYANEFVTVARRPA